MWVGRRMAQIFVDAINKRIADRMLHVFGLFMYLVPRIAQSVHEELLDQSMPSQHAQRQRAASVR